MHVSCCFGFNLPGTEPAPVPYSEALPPSLAGVSAHGAVVGVEGASPLAVAAEVAGSINKQMRQKELN